MGVALLFLLIVIASIIHEIRKSHKHEAKTGQPSKIPTIRAHIKTAPTKPQEVVVCKKEDSLLPKNSNNRNQRIVNRSRLRQSILASEILGKKY